MERRQELSLVEKMHDLLEAGDHPEIVQWCDDGESFIIYNRTTLPALVCRKSSSYDSWVRQMNFYGFKKVGKEKTGLLIYSHPLFMRGRPDLLIELRRSRQSNSRRALGKRFRGNKKRLRQFAARKSHSRPTAAPAPPQAMPAPLMMPSPPAPIPLWSADDPPVPTNVVDEPPASVVNPLLSSPPPAARTVKRPHRDLLMRTTRGRTLTEPAAAPTRGGYQVALIDEPSPADDWEYEEDGTISVPRRDLIPVRESPPDPSEVRDGCARCRVYHDRYIWTLKPYLINPANGIQRRWFFGRGVNDGVNNMLGANSKLSPSELMPPPPPRPYGARRSPGSPSTPGTYSPGATSPKPFTLGFRIDRQTMRASLIDRENLIAAAVSLNTTPSPTGHITPLPPQQRHIIQLGERLSDLPKVKRSSFWKGAT